MALLTFPLSLAQFFDFLPIEALTVAPMEAIEIDQTQGGEVLKADLGAALWQGQLDLSAMSWDEAIDIEPLINLLRRPGASFMVSDPRRPWPKLDPEGAILGAAAVKVLSIGASMRELAFKGLPAGYRLSRGDRFSFTYGAGPVRHALHELVGSATAGAGGSTALIEVTPPLRTGIAADTAVQLIWPACKAVLQGGAQTGTSRADITQDASLGWVQTLR